MNERFKKKNAVRSSPLRGGQVRLLVEEETIKLQTKKHLPVI